jgi:small redox-active disulfide protein 2
MMKVQILGTGCPKCKKLAANAEEAIAASGVDAEIVKIDKLGEIMEFGVMMTPALAIDGEVKASGKVLSAAEIAEMLKGA